MTGDILLVVAGEGKGLLDEEREGLEEREESSRGVDWVLVCREGMICGRESCFLGRLGDMDEMVYEMLRPLIIVSPGCHQPPSDSEG